MHNHTTASKPTRNVMGEYSEADVHWVMNALASIPSMNCTLNDADAHELLMRTGGFLLACGWGYDIIVTPLGVGVNRITLKSSC